MIAHGCAIAHAALRHAATLGLDAAKLAVGGDSGGGYIAVGACAMLARSGEAAQVGAVEAREQPVRLVSAVLPEGVTHLSQIDALELVTQGELWTPSAAQLHDDVSR